jgi:glycosyltransferase involved in cell wall biosynthesis
LFILKTLRKEKPDVFHTNSSKMGGMGNLAGRMTGIKKIVFTSHGWAFNENRNWLSKIIIMELVWYTILLSHKTICVSEKSKRDVSWLPFIKNKLAVIHNGIEKFELIPRTDTGFTVGTIAELHHIKGLDILLKAWKEFKKNNSGKLLILGEGEEKKKLENMAQQLGISDSVVFKGFVDNARSLLLGFDIFVLPSRSENLPYAILEAGMASRAVIASRVGGIPEIIKNEDCGILVPKENIQALTNALIKLTNDRNLRETLGNNLHKIVTEQFSKEKMVGETLETYK